MIRNSLKTIKKTIRKKYPKPFDVSTFIKTKPEVAGTYIVIKDFNKEAIAEFKYNQEDGAILIGYDNSPKYREYYEKNFPELHIKEHLNYYQEVFDKLHENSIFKELFEVDLEPLKVTEDMFSLNKECIKRLHVNKTFKNLVPAGLHISICFQYYVNDNFMLKPRMKFNFEFDDFGSLILYYDYDTKCLHFGEIQFVDSETFKDLNTNNVTFINNLPFYITKRHLQMLGLDTKKTDIEFYALNNDESYSLMSINQQDPIKTFSKLKSIFDKWMMEIGVLINKKIAVFYKLDNTFEPDAKENVVDNFNILKMTLI